MGMEESLFMFETRASATCPGISTPIRVSGKGIDAGSAKMSFSREGMPPAPQSTTRTFSSLSRGVSGVAFDTFTSDFSLRRMYRTAANWTCEARTIRSQNSILPGWLEGSTAFRGFCITSTAPYLNDS
jgi:hypothetical protein